MHNPNHKIRLFKLKTRERFLTPEERRHVEETLLRGLQIPPGRKGHLDRMSVWALQLPSLTGLRRDEILTLTWPMVDWQHGCLNLPDTKTGQRNVPVPSQVMTLLKRIHDHTGNRKDGLLPSVGGRPDSTSGASGCGPSGALALHEPQSSSTTKTCARWSGSDTTKPALINDSAGPWDTT